MRRTLSLFTVAAFAFSLAGAASAAAPCRDAKGKFIKCPPPAAAKTQCRDVKTKKFAKCGLPGTEAVPAKK